MIRRRLLVHGLVQGVCFRMYARDTARQLGLRGWVRNLRDGARVEAVVEGEEGAVQRFVDWCHQGPSMAQVEKVEIYEERGGESLSGFAIRR